MPFDLSAISPKTLPLTPFERKLTQPNGIVEEGLFEHIVNVIHPQNRFCVEFGAGDGTNYSFARNLVEKHGYSAFLIEADPELSARLTKKYEDSTKVKTLRSFLSKENIVKLFEDAHVPENPAVICIDIDGNDFYMWEALSAKYRPDVLCIEFNASYGSDKEFVIPYKEDFCWKGDDFFGASFATLVNFTEKKGYKLIHCTSAGDNLIFVRSELASKFESGKMRSKDLYQIPQYGKNGRGPNGKGHPASPITTSTLERLWLKARYRLMAVPRKIVYAKHDPKGHAK